MVYPSQLVPPVHALPSLAEDVRSGLLSKPRSISPKYFYDDSGSLLFDRICETPEYYPCRTEAALLQHCSAEIMALTKPAHLLELGSGSARKTRHLLNANSRLCYWPFDVCQSMLEDSALALDVQYPHLSIRPLVGDYHGGLRRLPRQSGRYLVVFLGGTIGNFSHSEAVLLLRDIRAYMAADDHLLIGVDRVKDEARLNRAYNDSAGLTEAFNKNMLHVLNRRLQANFEPNSFTHLARYEAARSQIEMHLVAQGEQHVHLQALDSCLRLADGERILTEISRKFTRASVEDLLAEGGFVMRRHFSPPEEDFSLLLAHPSPEAE